MALNILASRTGQLDNIIEDSEGSKIHAVDFEMGENSFTTVDKIPLTVVKAIAVLSDDSDDISDIVKIDHIERAIISLVEKDQRKKFEQAMYDEGIGVTEVVSMFSILLEEMAKVPLDSSSSESDSSSGVKKKSTPKSSSAVKK